MIWTKDINQEYTRRVEMHEQLSGQEVHAILRQQHDTQTHQVTIHHAHEVHEARIAHESRISVEDAESRVAQQREADHRRQHLECVFVEGICLVEDPIYDKTTECHDAAVDQEDAPVRQ